MFLLSTRRVQLYGWSQNSKNITMTYLRKKKNKVKNFYDSKIRQLDKSQKIICREASIQVVLQLTLLLYQEILILSIKKNKIIFSFYDSVFRRQSL